MKYTLTDKMEKDRLNCGEDITEDFTTDQLKKCIIYEDGCEEWAGCPCIYYKEV